MKDSGRGGKYLERRRRAWHPTRIWWVAVLEGPTVIDVLTAGRLDLAEQCAAAKYPGRQLVCRLWSSRTVNQRAQARAALPQTRLIPLTEEA
jgi:hypothetical protein